MQQKYRLRVPIGSPCLHSFIRLLYISHERKKKPNWKGTAYIVDKLKKKFFSYPACKVHAPYYIVICGLSDSTVLLYIISQKV